MLATTNLRGVIGELDLDATLSGRERINSSLLAILDGATDPWGVKVTRVEVRKVEPPENLVRAMNLQMTAERERRATVMRADGERAAAIQRAEGEKQALVLAAEGRQQAAERDAQARERLAAAEAVATRLVAEAAAGAGEAALRYFISDRYVRAFEALAGNPSSKLVVVPMEAAGLTGGVTAALESLKPGHPAQPPRPAGPTAGASARDTAVRSASSPAAEPMEPRLT
ncbi:SPFH domain-containing protein [Dankookia sp. P2]|uniref:SPFH domain-containing protein n=1 Tax=Dankookia sp. P2 TaxID=3423955 RepID=UPI003D664A4B